MLAMLIGRAPSTRSRLVEPMPRFSLLILAALLTISELLELLLTLTKHTAVLLILAAQVSIDACQWTYEHREAILTRANAIRNRAGQAFCYA